MTTAGSASRARRPFVVPLVAGRPDETVGGAGAVCRPCPAASPGFRLRTATADLAGALFAKAGRTLRSAFAWNSCCHGVHAGFSKTIDIGALRSDFALTPSESTSVTSATTRILREFPRAGPALRSM